MKCCPHSVGPVKWAQSQRDFALLLLAWIVWPKSFPRVSPPRSVTRSPFPHCVLWRGASMCSHTQRAGPRCPARVDPLLRRDASCYTPSGVSSQPERWVEGTVGFPFWLLSFRDSPRFDSLRFGVLLLQARKTGSAASEPAAACHSGCTWPQAKSCAIELAGLCSFWPVRPTRIFFFFFFFFLFPLLCL